MRQLPVLLLVVAALGIFYLAFPFGEDAPVTAPILPPAGPNGPAVTVQNDGPVDLQRPTQDDGLAEVAAKFDAVSNIAVVRLADRDIVRHPLVAEMLGVL